MRRLLAIYLMISSVMILLSLTLSESYASCIIATGSKTGTYYKIGRDIADIAKKHGLNIIVRKSNGSIDNIHLMKNKRADIAIVQSDVIAKLYRVNPDIADHIRVIFPLYKEEVHILARRGITCIEDMNRKKVATGSTDSGTYTTISTLFFRNLIGKVDEVTRLSPPDAMISVLSGQIDAMVYVAGKPVALFKKMDKMALSPKYRRLIKGVHFLPISYGKIYQDYYVPSEIGPADYSWVEGKSPTLAVRALLVTYYEKANVTYDDCDPVLMKLVNIIRNDFDKLKKHGHEKWKEVDLNADVSRPWRMDPSCGRYGVDMEELHKLLK